MINTVITPIEVDGQFWITIQLDGHKRSSADRSRMPTRLKPRPDRSPDLSRTVS